MCARTVRDNISESVDANVVELVRAMARQMPDMAIAAALNRMGKTTGKGNSWTRSRVVSLRNDHDIAVYREGERVERGEATLDEAAEMLTVSPATIRRLIGEGRPFRQTNPAKVRLGLSKRPISDAPSVGAPTGEEGAHRGRRVEDQPTLHLDFQ